ncbi:ceramide-1-phosphate transfer protein-like [Lytechinus pictus]|uniref:ceramide-1-phosphate transfer protein-like n=1 Tax=Lytechinus pictus TaxID=7653 RepID=UPI0030B9CB7C
MTEKMDIVIVRDCFKAAKKEDGTINIEDIMRGYEEIARLYDMMGSLFTFVSKDMRYRLKALETHRSDDTLSANYQTVQAVLDYETANGIKRKSKRGGLSGNRALHEMHFDIEFFIEMFITLAAGNDESKCSELSRQAFDKTLSNNVNFAVRQAARLAMRWLPTRKEFIDSYLKQDTAQALELIEPTTTIMKQVYDVMESGFKKHNIKN